MTVELDEISFVSETTLTIRGSRRRTTVPKAVVDKLSMRDGDKLRWVLYNDDRILLVPVNEGI